MITSGTNQGIDNSKRLALLRTCQGRIKSLSGQKMTTTHVRGVKPYCRELKVDTTNPEIKFRRTRLATKIYRCEKNMGNMIDSASLIKRVWKDHRKRCYQLPQSIPGAASILGEKASSFNQIIDAHENGAVILQAVVVDKNPFLGHSAFYYSPDSVMSLFFVGKKTMESCTDEGLKDTCSSMYPFKIEKQPYLDNLHRNFEKESHLYSWIGLSYSDNQKLECESRTRHLIEKGCLYIINKEYTNDLKKAMTRERARFVRMPYSYGLQYNCHTFVFNCLQRVIERKNLSEKLKDRLKVESEAIKIQSSTSAS